MKLTTLKGFEFDLLDMTNNIFDIEEIAHALSMQCRFNGHVNKFYSVAQHCVIASRMIKGDSIVKLGALMHDSAEAYTGDIITPLKRLLPELAVIESRIARFVENKIGVAISAPEIKEVDKTILVSEFTNFTERDFGVWGEESGLFKIIPWSIEESRRAFEHEFQTLALDIIVKHGGDHPLNEVMCMS